MIQNNYFTENEDMMTYFQELVDWKEIVEAYEGADFADAKEFAESGNERLAMAPNNLEEALEYYRSILESVGELTGKELAPNAQKMDHQGLKLENGKVQFPQEHLDIYEKWLAAGLVPFKMTRGTGGLGLPVTAQVLLTDILNRGDVSFAMALGLMGVAEIVTKFGTKEQAEKYVTRVTSGEYMGAMVLTEPNFGSDLSSVQTKAIKQDDGAYRITGTKRFISQGCGLGDHPCLMLTLARTGSPTSGARGLSLFIVDSRDAEIASIEHKLGIKCSPTCEVVFDNVQGELLGKEGFGLTRYALGMMNDARVSTGALGVGVGTAAYYEAKKYASEREQFGKTIDQIPAVKRILDEMEREVNAMRILTGEAARSIDLYQHRQVKLAKDGVDEREIRKDEQIRTWERIATMFTPMSKYYCSETCVSLASMAIQVHGGAGYTEEYDVARIFRDSRISTVYEGTTQLQVVAIIGGLVAGMTPTGYFRNYLNTEMGKFTPSDICNEHFKQLEEAVEVYKSIEDGKVRDSIAFEVVRTGTRFLCGMLMERAATRLSGEKKARQERLTEAFHIDSMALAQGDLYRLKAAAKSAKVPVAV